MEFPTRPAFSKSSMQIKSPSIRSTSRTMAVGIVKMLETSLAIVLTMLLKIDDVRFFLTGGIAAEKTIAGEGNRS